MSDSITGSELIRRNLGEFARAAIKAAHPSPIDGLKPVHRRVLVKLAGHDQKLIKSQKMVGEASELHPHGDASIYNAAARLAQTFEYNPTLLHIEGGRGSYGKPNPAAMRYTEVKLEAFTWDIFFKGIEVSAIPKELDELLSGYEPSYLIPAIPTALLYANNSIGYGYSSYTLPHTLTDVCDLAVAYCQHVKTEGLKPFDYAKHAEKFLPDFPIRNTITNHEQLVAAYKRGEFNTKVELEGEVQLTFDEIIIRTLPYGKPFEKLMIRETGEGGGGKGASTIPELLMEKDGYFDRNILWVKSLSNAHEIGNVTVKLKRGVNVFEVWEQLRKKIPFSYPQSPIPNYNIDGTAVEISQPNLLAHWYEARHNLLVASKKRRLTAIAGNIRRTEALLIVCTEMDAVIKIIRNHDRVEGKALLQKKYDLTPFQVDFLYDTSLSILSKTSKEEQTQRRATLMAEYEAIRQSFATIVDEIAEEARTIKKKYATPRRSRLARYAGYVKINGGCIQFEHTDEIAQIVSDFPKAETEIYVYDGPHLYKVTDGNKLETGSISKITTGDIYGLKSNSVVTVNITDKTACCVKGFVPGLRQEGYFYTTPRSRVIRRNGEIKLVDITETIPVRKTICRGAATDIIYVYPELKHDHFIIALNTSTPNTVVVQRISTERSKIPLNPQGSAHVVHSASKHVFVNIPPKFLNRNATRVVEFHDLEELLGKDNQYRLDLNSAKVKTNKLITLY